jgi:hypothetical protein
VGESIGSGPQVGDEAGDVGGGAGLSGALVDGGEERSDDERGIGLGVCVAIEPGVEFLVPILVTD